MIQTLYSVLAQKALVISRADEEGYEGDSGSDSGSDSNNVETPRKVVRNFYTRWKNTATVVLTSKCAAKDWCL